MDSGGQKNEAKMCQKSCGNIQVPTEDEVAALNAMRDIKVRVREIKKRLSEISGSKKTEDSHVRSALEKEMAQLRESWHEWEKKRKAAANLRMVLLGHEKA